MEAETHDVKCGAVFRAGTNSPATCILGSTHKGPHADRIRPMADVQSDLVARLRKMKERAESKRERNRPRNERGELVYGSLEAMDRQAPGRVGAEFLQDCEDFTTLALAIAWCER